MFAYVIILTSCVGYGFADRLICESYIPSEQYNAAPIPDERELDLMCPGFLKYLECSWKVMETDPDDFDDDDLVNLYFVGKDIVRDLCSEKTKIRKDYLASQSCFINIADKFDGCLEDAKAFYEEYNKTNAGREEIPSDEKNCFPRGHAVGCMAKKILHKCGPLEHSTYLQLVGRSRYLFKFCEPSTMLDLVSNYLETVDLQDNVTTSALLYSYRSPSAM